MKTKHLVPLLFIFTVAFTPLAEGKTVYFFLNLADNTGSDARMIQDLKDYFGVDIEIFDDTNAAGNEMPDYLDDADAMYSSESVSSGNIAGMLYHELDAVPQITGEQALHDDLSFAGGGNGTTNGVSINIIDNEHPITQGFDLGEVKITDSSQEMGYLNNPPEWVRVLATETGNPNHAVLWIIEKDADVQGWPSPHMRVGTFLQGNDLYETINDAGRQLIMNIFAYALEEESPEILVKPDVKVDGVRAISREFVNPGSTIMIKILLNVEHEKSADITLKETIPGGLPISNINESTGEAVLQDGVITWTMTGAIGGPTLSYEITAPSSLGAFIFNGEFTVQGSLPIIISGDSAFGVAKAPSGKTAYIFRNIGDNSDSDNAIILDWKVYFGLDVHEFDDTNATGYEMPETLEGAVMMFASESVSSGNVGGLLYQDYEEATMITGEQALHDDFSYNSNPTGTNGGNTIEIVDNEHPITEGFDLGPLQISNGSHDLGGLNDPPAWVRVLAVNPDQPERAVLWIIEKGADVEGWLSPGVRIGTWVQGVDAYADLNQDGKQLFLQIFAYAIGEETPYTAVREFMFY